MIVDRENKQKKLDNLIEEIMNNEKEFIKNKKQCDFGPKK